MGLGAILLVAVALGTDAFSLAVGIGMNRVKTRQIVLIAATVMVFHVVMPLIGLIAGNFLGGLLGQMAVFVGGGVLVIIGLQMIRENLKKKAQVIPIREARKKLPGLRSAEIGHNTMTFSGILLLAASVSLDALSVGFSLGTWRVVIPLTVLIIGVVAGAMTAAGLLFGRRMSFWVGDRAGLIGGIVLIAIGVKMLVS